jgi:HAD superfamily hydrolase (TIGR01458 family)
MKLPFSAGGGHIRSLLLDLEGTLYFKERLIDGAQDAIDRIRGMGVKVRFLTNNDSLSPDSIQRNLCKLGLAVDSAEIFTPVTAALGLLGKSGRPNGHFLVSDELRELFREHESSEPEWVVVGDFRDKVRYNEINTAFRHLMNGARLVALQKGRYFVREDGLYLDAGGFVSMFEFASGKEAIVLGKPSPDFFAMGLQSLGATARETVVVGDDITTDILGGQAAGCATVLVQTGKYDPAAPESAVMPGHVIRSIADLPDWLAAGRP